MYTSLSKVDCLPEGGGEYNMLAYTGIQSYFLAPIDYQSRTTYVTPATQDHMSPEPINTDCQIKE